MGSDRNPELISGLCAVDHLEEFNRINVAFVHAELSFCVGSRFCLSLWRWRCGRGNSSCSTDLWNREANREERTVLAQVLRFGFKCLPTQIQLLSVGRLSSGICSVLYAGFWLVSLWITHKNTSMCSLVTRCKVIPTAYRFLLLCWFWSACFCQFLECVTLFSLRRISPNKMSTNVTQHLKPCMFFFSYCKHGVKAH